MAAVAAKWVKGACVSKLRGKETSHLVGVKDDSHQLNRLALVELASKLASNEAITGGAGVREGQCDAFHTIHAMRARGAL
jgi:hypothetical protein